MSANRIIPRSEAFLQAFISNRQQLNTAGEIRHRVRFLRTTFGDCLNTWPDYAQAEYHTLARRLRQIENVRS